MGAGVTQSGASRGGVVMWVLTSHQCGPDSIMGVEYAVDSLRVLQSSPPI